MPNYNWGRLMGTGLSSRFASLTCFGGRDSTRSLIMAETQGSISRLILDNNGFSDYVQLAAGKAGARRRLGYGTVSVGGGSATVSKTYTGIAHGIDATPEIVVATANTELLNCACTSLASSDFTLIVRHIDGSTWNSTHIVYWAAVS